MDDRRHLMSDRDRDAQFGKDVRDLENIRSQLETRKSQAAEAADSFEKLIKMLRENPRDIFFTDDSVPGAEFSRHTCVFDASEIEVAGIQKLVHLIRTLEEKEKQLTAKLALLGYNK
jgi:hypothetical protein